MFSSLAAICKVEEESASSSKYNSGAHLCDTIDAQLFHVRFLRCTLIFMTVGYTTYTEHTDTAT